VTAVKVVVVAAAGSRKLPMEISVITATGFNKKQLEKLTVNRLEGNNVRKFIHES